MKIQKTTEPKVPNPLPVDGLTDTIKADAHVHIQYAGGRWGWRVVVDTAFWPRHLMEGLTAEELGDAMESLMVSVQQAKPLKIRKALPTPMKRLGPGE